MYFCIYMCWRSVLLCFNPVPSNALLYAKQRQMGMILTVVKDILLMILTLCFKKF
jgi:hypothetical protein